MRKTTMLAAVLSAALLAASPAAAKPAKKPKLKAGTFKLTIEGEQLTTWKFTKKQAPSCDWPELANGRQYIEFGTYDFGDTKTPKVKVKPNKDGGVSLDFVRDDITLTAEAKLERHYQSLYSQMSDCPPGGGPFGGGDPPKNEVGSAKCSYLGELYLFTGSSIGEVENPSYPTGIPEADDDKDRFFFAGDPYWGSAPGEESLPAACSSSGQHNADIGITVSQGEWAGAVIPAGSRFSAKKLLDPRKKKTTIELGRTVKYPNAEQPWPGPDDTTGQTRMDVSFTFKRVGR